MVTLNTNKTKETDYDKKIIKGEQGEKFVITMKVGLTSRKGRKRENGKVWSVNIQYEQNK